MSPFVFFIFRVQKILYKSDNIGVFPLKVIHVFLLIGFKKDVRGGLFKANQVILKCLSKFLLKCQALESGQTISCTTLGNSLTSMSK